MQVSDVSTSRLSPRVSEPEQQFTVSSNKKIALISSDIPCIFHERCALCMTNLPEKAEGVGKRSLKKEIGVISRGTSSYSPHTFRIFCIYCNGKYGMDVDTVYCPSGGSCQPV